MYVRFICKIPDINQSFEYDNKIILSQIYFWKKMTLKNRIRFSFLVLGMFLIFNGILAIVGSKKTFNAASSLAYKDLPTVVENSRMNGIAKDMRSLIYRLHLKNANDEIVGKIAERYSELYEEYLASKREYLAVPFSSDHEKNLFMSVNKNFDDWVNVSKELIELKKANFNSPDFESILSTNYREAANTYLSSMTEFLDELSANSKRKINLLEETNKRNEIFLIASVIIGLIVAISGSTLISKSTGNRLENLYSTFKDKHNALAANCRIGDELSQNNLSRVDSQASAIDQTSGAAQETCKSIEAVALQAKRLKDQTGLNKEYLGESGNSLNKLDDSIKNVNEINEKLNFRLEKNNEDLRRIINIFHEIELKTNLINEIVFQTKLLSFNASVEAARAGEYGKGFSVVANEINDLAAKSGNSSREIFSLLQVSQGSINDLIEISTAETKKIVSLFNQTVENCVRLSEESKRKIQQAITSTNESFLCANEISISTDEQVSALAQISNVMFSLQNINKDNEIGAKESARLLVEIKKSANEIDESIKYLVYGNSHNV